MVERYQIVDLIFFFWDFHWFVWNSCSKLDSIQWLLLLIFHSPVEQTNFSHNRVAQHFITNFKNMKISRVVLDIIFFLSPGHFPSIHEREPQENSLSACELIRIPEVSEFGPFALIRSLSLSLAHRVGVFNSHSPAPPRRKLSRPDSLLQVHIRFAQTPRFFC